MLTYSLRVELPAAALALPEVCLSRRLRSRFDVVVRCGFDLRRGKTGGHVLRGLEGRLEKLVFFLIIHWQSGSRGLLDAMLKVAAAVVYNQGVAAWFWFVSHLALFGGSFFQDLSGLAAF
jgi:hypothetical protein